MVKTEIYEHQQNSQLNSSEIGDLWNNYMGDSLFSCVFEHFLQVVEDEEVKELLLFNLGLSRKHLVTIAEIYAKEGIPVPAAFGPSDVNTGAPRLFDDTFILFYLQQMTVGGFGQYTRALSGSIRQDIIDFFRQGIEELNEIYERSTHLMLEKGTIMKAPKIPYPKQVEFVEKKSFSSFMSNRPLAAVEIKYLHLNIASNILGKSLMMGFSQVAASKTVRKYFQDGRNLADKQVTQLGAMLANENIPAPMIMDPHVTDSQVPPFSDKLMLYHTGLAFQLGMEYIGISMSRTLRHDIHAKYAKFIVEIGVLASQGQQILIDQGLLEQLPLSVDRDKIVLGV